MFKIYFETAVIFRSDDRAEAQRRYWRLVLDGIDEDKLAYSW